MFDDSLPEMLFSLIPRWILIGKKIQNQLTNGKRIAGQTSHAILVIVQTRTCSFSIHSLRDSEMYMHETRLGIRG